MPDSTLVLLGRPLQLHLFGKAVGVDPGDDWSDVRDASDGIVDQGLYAEFDSDVTV